MAADSEPQSALALKLICVLTLCTRPERHGPEQAHRAAHGGPRISQTVICPRSSACPRDKRCLGRQPRAIGPQIDQIRESVLSG